ncbi:hypothetical protein ASF44_03395 [Pseudorhodoferax sp. Leaf274]|nr:hypothetical protein ASF44_03395 [Pseudorhodoferax sp. Leaf274]
MTAHVQHFAGSPGLKFNALRIVQPPELIQHFYGRRVLRDHVPISEFECYRQATAAAAHDLQTVHADLGNPVAAACTHERHIIAPLAPDQIRMRDHGFCQSRKAGTELDVADAAGKARNAPCKVSKRHCVVRCRAAVDAEFQLVLAQAYCTSDVATDGDL